MTDYKSMKPVMLLPAKTRLDADDEETGPVIDTLGFRKLLVLINTGEAEGAVFQRHQLQFSADGTNFTSKSGALLLSVGVQGSASQLGGKQTVGQGWIDLTPENRYIRVIVDRTTNSVGATDEHPTAVTGILMDPVDTQYAGTAPYYSGTGYTEDPFFKIDAHNRA